MKTVIATSSRLIDLELSRLLEAEGHQCLSISDNGSTIDTIYSENPDLIMLSLTLSKPSTIEILKKLKAAPSTRDIPVIVIASAGAQQKLAKCYELGAYDYVSVPFFPEELKARLLNIGYVREKMRELEKLLVRDYLTGLYNRKFFMERFVEELAWASRYGEPLSIIILDIDFFKKINDTHGHSCGDDVLIQLSRRLQAELRSHDILARYGGEEFIVLLSNTDGEGALQVGERLREAVQGQIFSCEELCVMLPVTISSGVVSSEGGTDLTPDSMIMQADQALYAAKAAGRNRVVLHTP
jgi:two-component system cell cycle response regulator